MPLDAARSTSRIDALNEAHAEIGHAGATAMPRCSLKGTALVKERAAYRLFVAQHGRRRWETEWNAALSGAADARVIPDHLAHPEPVGTNRVTFKGTVVEVSVAVAAPIEQFSLNGFVADLAASKLDAAALRLVRRLIAKHTCETRPAHKFTASASSMPGRRSA